MRIFNIIKNNQLALKIFSDQGTSSINRLLRVIEILWKPLAPSIIQSTAKGTANL